MVLVGLIYRGGGENGLGGGDLVTVIGHRHHARHRRGVDRVRLDNLLEDRQQPLPALGRDRPALAEGAAHHRGVLLLASRVGQGDPLTPGDCASIFHADSLRLSQPRQPSAALMRCP